MADLLLFCYRLKEINLKTKSYYFWGKLQLFFTKRKDIIVSIIVADKAILCHFREYFQLPNIWDFLYELYIIFEIEEKLEGLL